METGFLLKPSRNTEDPAPPPPAFRGSEGVGSPVVEMHDGLQRVPSPGGDVPLEPGEQRGHHVHTVPLTLPTHARTRTRTHTYMVKAAV